MNQEGQTLASKFRILCQAQPLIINKQLIGFDETVRCDYCVILNTDTLLVTNTIKGCENFFGKLPSFIDNGIGQIARCLRKALELIQPRLVKYLVDDKPNVPGWCNIVSHDGVTQ